MPRENRYVGGGSSGGYAVRDTWAGKNGVNIETYATENQCMDRVVELNRVYIEIEEDAKK
jgi:hypothetical protein